MRAFRSLAVLAVLFAAGCFAPNEVQMSDKAPTTVEVENRNFQDMTVYVLRSGQRIRLGRIGGLGTETFTIPADVVRGSTTLRFVADPVGGAAEVSMEIAVLPGDMLQLIIPPS